MAERIALNAQQEANKYRWEAVRDQWLHIYRELTARAG